MNMLNMYSIFGAEEGRLTVVTTLSLLYEMTLLYQHKSRKHTQDIES